jgi:putative SOS response-associated peptidase YedK
MCGRIIQSGGPELPGLKIHLGTPDDPRIKKPRYNGAPSQDLRVIRRHRETGEDRVDLLRWGLIPYWVKELNPKTKPINATVDDKCAMSGRFVLVLIAESHSGNLSSPSW